MAPAAPSPATVLYIAGLGRSGSTLLERTFARLPGAVAVGEVVHMWRRGLVENERCGCGEPFRSCPFWTEVGERAYGGWDQLDVERIAELSESVDRTRYVPYMVSSRGPRHYLDAVEQLVSVLGPLYPAIAATAGEEVVIDSSKDPSYAYLLRRAAEVRLEVVQAIRDAPAVAYSWSRRVERPDADDSLMVQWAPRRTAVLWAGQNLVTRGLAQRGVRVELARYEDFVADPAGTFSRLVEALELPRPGEDDPLVQGLRDGFIDLGVDHTVSGNPIRFRTGRMQIREDSAWKQGLASSDRRLVEAITAPVRWRFGYLPARPDRSAASV
jgi:hypothetical protein